MPCRLLHACVAEFVGTYLLVFFGVGAVHVAVLTGAYAGLWQVAAVWGIAVALAIYATAGASGAHLNPAITVAMATYRGFPGKRVPAYAAAQTAGALAAAATLYGIFCHLIAVFEASQHIVRGQPGSELSAMIYGEYFPNPAIVGVSAKALASISPLQGMLAEGLGTALLAFFVFAVTEPRRTEPAATWRIAGLVGVGLAIIICVIAPITQAGLNPARDFGPRLFAFLAGWNRVALPGPRGGFFTVYIVAPVVGAVAGAAIWQFFMRPGLPTPDCLDNRLDRGQHNMDNTRLILVGGFLGAGKTTLLGRVASRLADQGRRAALLANDQAPDLVDTAVLKESGAPVDEVAGGCFCCRFPDLLAAMERLVRQARPDVILAEPVGSCTDLSATVLQPLVRLYGQRFRLAPFSVLVDAKEATRLLRRDEAARQPDTSLFPDNVLYIYRKQLEEADLIVLNKADLVPAAELERLRAALAEQFPDTRLVTMSALNGEGVDAWLECLDEDGPVGRRIAEVDYDTYAAGEAALGWMNASAALLARADTDWHALAQGLLAAVRDGLRASGGTIAHLKLFLTTSGRGSVAGNVTGNEAAPQVRGQIDPAVRETSLLVNARVHIRPDSLQAIVEQCLRSVAGAGVEVALNSVRSFFPARPEPTYRFAAAADDSAGPS